MTKLIGDDGANTLTGGDGDDSLSGLGGDDSLVGGAGADTLTGGLGDDTLRGGAGDDRLVGGDGDNRLYDEGANSTIVGSGGADFVQVYVANGGSADGHTSIQTGGGNDNVYADYDVGEVGVIVTINAGAGNDYVAVQGATFTADLGTGNDRLDLSATGAGSVFTLGKGNDSVVLYSPTHSTVISDFDARSGHDHLALGESFDRSVHSTPDGVWSNPGDLWSDGYLQVISRDGAAVIQVDYDGGGDSWEDSLILPGASRAAIMAMIAPGLPRMLVGTEAGDQISGGKSADIINGEGGNDHVLAGAGEDAVNGGLGADTLEGGAGFDALHGGLGDDSLIGGEGNDTLLGGAGNDVLLGGLGDDSVDGGGGADTIDGGAGIDRMSFAASSQAVTLDMTHAGAGAPDALVVSNVEQVLGSAFDDQITGADADESLHGGDGADTLNGGGGADWLDGGTGRNQLSGGDGDDLLTADGGDGVFNGGAGDDSVYVGGPIPDGARYTLQGGAGQDRLELQAFAVVTLDLSQSKAQTLADGRTIKLSGIEWLQVDSDLAAHLTGGSGNDILSADGADSTLAGGGGNDTLYGGGSGSTLDGGTGNDVLHVTDWRTEVVIGGDGQDTVVLDRGFSGSIAVSTWSGIEGVVGSDGDDNLLGTSVANSLDGGGGDDTIRGGGGLDTLSGGDGLDLLQFGPRTTALVVDLAVTTAQDTGAGVLVISGFERLNGGDGDDIFMGGASGDSLAGGNGDDRLTGRDGADTLSGGNGSDTLAGGSGDDVLRGGNGFNTADYSAAAAPVSVSLLAGTADGEGHDSLDNIQAVVGSAFADTLVGGGANDVLTGGAGKDLLTGGGDVDTFVFASGDGQDTITDFGSDDILAFTTYASYQSLQQVGADTLVVLSASDSILLRDVTASALTPANFRFGDPDGHGQSIDGSAKADFLVGQDGPDTIHGLAGDDTLSGGDGDDVLSGGVGDNIFHGGAGVDTADFSSSELVWAYLEDGGGLYVISRTRDAHGHSVDDHNTGDGIENLKGSPGNDTIYGDSNANLLDGGLGGDTIVSGGGADTMTGADGYDTFRFFNGDATPGAPVTLAGFVVASDVVDLKGIDADTSTAADDAFHFVGSFTGHAGEANLAYKAGTDVTTLTLDVNGDAVADYVILIDGRVSENAHWVL